MIALILFAALLVAGVVAVSVGVVWALMPLVRLHRFRFGRQRELSTAEHDPLSDLGLTIEERVNRAKLEDARRNVVTLAPEDWWIVDE